MIAVVLKLALAMILSLRKLGEYPHRFRLEFLSKDSSDSTSVSEAFNEVSKFKYVKSNDTRQGERSSKSVGKIHRKEDPSSYQPRVNSSKAYSKSKMNFNFLRL